MINNLFVFVGLLYDDLRSQGLTSGGRRDFFKKIMKSIFADGKLVFLVRGLVFYYQLCFMILSNEKPICWLKKEFKKWRKLAE